VLTCWLALLVLLLVEGKEPLLHLLLHMGESLQQRRLERCQIVHHPVCLLDNMLSSVLEGLTLLSHLGAELLLLLVYLDELLLDFFVSGRALLAQFCFGLLLMSGERLHVLAQRLGRLLFLLDLLLEALMILHDEGLLARNARQIHGVNGIGDGGQRVNDGSNGSDI
jgi:hypothetical protein